MNNAQTRTIAIFAALAALMAATRFDHFGSAVSLPDASLAVFFLGGLYLARSARASMAAFIALIMEAGLIDYYATSVQGVSDWCMTPAYWFLIPTYGSLWFVGRWFTPRLAKEGHAMQGKGLVRLSLLAWAACSFAFMFSNVTFYLFSGRFADMSATEYASRVAQYYGSYVSVALLYIACAVALHMAFDIIVTQRVHSRS
ncbi:MAG: hypothetical protein A2V79_07285 [Betaproteobacteria bacterium RBG_16_56_24]|nr:MAG: hypothetical protein A2V79_07285 [Betaproteobacteria bacterium RBG_16_56_24]